ncbi:MAG: CCA tRNA nucleotidyltransferase, partial [Bacteroidota bacterium]
MPSIPNYKNALDSPIFKTISKAASNLSLDSYVIGGYVRDLILRRGDAKDIDVVAVGSGIELAGEVARLLPGKHKVAVFKNYGTAMIRFKDLELEFVGARKESYREDSRNPAVENGTLEDDQNRRDFTINALALSLKDETYGQLLDPFDGIGDLERKLIRTPLDPDITFSDDPLRMLRAIRFATQLDFSIEKESLEAITRNASRIKIISKERVVDEIHKIVAAPVPSIGFSLLHKTGLLPHIFPEL